jgi:hypothetical protein
MENKNLATSHARDFHLPPQSNGESDVNFINRVADTLRSQGHIIEAHEARTGKFYDDNNEDAMTGIMGAVAQAMQGTRYGGNQVGNDIAAGTVAKSPKNEMTAEMALLMVLLGK